MRKLGLCLILGMIFCFAATPAKADFITRVISVDAGFQTAEVSDGFGNVRIITMPTNSSLGYSTFNSYSSGSHYNSGVEFRAFPSVVEYRNSPSFIQVREVNHFHNRTPDVVINQRNVIINERFRRR